MMNRFLTVLLGLLSTGAGCLLGTLAILSLVGISEQELPLVPLVLVLATSFSMMCLGLFILMSYAYRTSFDNNDIELHFVFRQERVPWESIQWHRNIFFRNTFSGKANVWVLLKYKTPHKSVVHTRMAVLLVAGTGPAVGITKSDFVTPFDSFLSRRPDGLM